MQRNPLISVIVPIYNVAPWLPRCLDSIIGQTYKNLEILLINDGSTDNSLEICQTYAAKDPRIKVIHQENQGVSAARNAGLDNAQGDFIMFVDSDDWLTLDACEKLLNTQKQTNADIVIGNFYFFQDGIPPCAGIPSIKTNISSPLINLHDTFGIAIKSLCVICGKLYPRTALISLRFNPKYKLGEDVDFLFQAIEKFQNFAFLSSPIYYYYFRPHSAIWTSAIQDHIGAVEIWKKIALFCKKLKFRDLDTEVATRITGSSVLLAVAIILYDPNNLHESSLLDTRTYLAQHWDIVLKGPFRFTAKIFLLLFMCFPLLTRYLCRLPKIHSCLEKNFYRALTHRNNSNLH